jgi:hypothetical protein
MTNRVRDYALLYAMQAQYVDVSTRVLADVERAVMVRSSYSAHHRREVDRTASSSNFSLGSCTTGAKESSPNR